MEIKNNIKIHNRFDIEIIDKNTGEVKQSLVSYNIVLSQMYTRLCGGLAYFANIHFGSGTGTLSPSRTTLFSHLGTKSAVDEEIIKTVPLSSWKRKIVLNPEEYVGNTISEVGIAYGSTNTNLVTHSLLKDSEGNSISIVKTDVDVITIYATVFVTLDTSNPNLTYLSMPSSNQLVNYLIGGSAAPTGAFSLNDVFLGQTRLGSTSAVTWTSDTVNKQRKTNVPRFATTVANGHVKFLEFANLFSLEIPTIGVFNGQDYLNVPLGSGDGSNRVFDVPSANIRQSSLVLKKNGVVVNDLVKSIYKGGFRTGIPIFTNYINSDYAFSRDRNTILVKKSSNTSTTGIYVYKKDGESFLLNIDSDVMNKPYAISDDGNTVVGAQTGTTWYGRIFRFIDGIYTQIINTSRFEHACYTNNNNDFVTVGGGTLRFWKYNGSTYQNIGSISVGSGVSKVHVTKDGMYCVVGFDSSSTSVFSAYVWDGSSFVKKGTTPIFVSKETCEGLCISDDGNVVTVANSAVSTFVWDGSDWVEKSLPITILGTLRDTKLSGDGQILYITTSTNVYVFDYVNGIWVNRRTDTAGYTDIYVIEEDSEYIYLKNGSVLLLCSGIPFTRVTFDTAPSTGDVITADYTVDGVHKTDQFVIDTSFAIQFGEI